MDPSGTSRVAVNPGRDSEKSAGSQTNVPKGQLAAHDAVRAAVKSGRLERRPCEECGAEKVHAHHDDYAKPLDVRWLCPYHHVHAHLAVKGEPSGPPTLMTWRKIRQNPELLTEPVVVVREDRLGVREVIGMWLPRYLIDELAGREVAD